MEQQETVVVSKADFDELLARLDKMQKQLDDIDHTVNVCTDLTSAIVEKLGCA